MPPRPFRIFGEVVDRATGRGVAGVRVEAWDKDTRYHDLLGIQNTDTQGRFVLRFTSDYFGDFAPDTLPDLFFKVFDGETLLASTENAVRWNADTGDEPILIPIDAPADVPLATPTSAEVTLTELGGSIASAVASVQQELALYQSALGAFVLDNLDIDVPVRMRMDEYGRVMATVADVQKPDAIVGRVNVRVKPVLGAVQPRPVNPGRPLESLGVLKQDAIETLAARRIFSVDDFARIAASPGGRAALGRVELGAPLDSVLERAAVLKLPEVPEAITEKLVELGVKGPADFVTRDPTSVATSLSARVRQTIPPEAVERWQRDVRELMRVPLPERTTDAVR